MCAQMFVLDLNFSVGPGRVCCSRSMGNSKFMSSTCELLVHKADPLSYTSFCGIPKVRKNFSGADIVSLADVDETG